jgi:hypothetical protein
MGGLALSSACAVAAVACTFSVRGLETNPGGGVDVEVPDGPPSTPDDLAGAPADDLTTTAPVDLANAVLPSFLPPTVVDGNAADLDRVTRIDTSALTIQRENDPTPGAPPPGVGFRQVNGIAVLTVGRMNIDRTLRVVGAAPLAIVAAKEISVNAEVLANAELDAAGPGGWPPAMGPGAGPSPSSSTGDDPGGAGGSYGTRGGRGGTGGQVMGPESAMTYGDALGATLRGGSGGGHGSDYLACPGGRGRGGGGGGALQFFSSSKIVVGGSARINANGGGGRGGCSTDEIGTGGGGGGAGGTLVFEAPVIEVKSNAWIVTHGGGGGGAGAAGLANGGDGQNGSGSLAAPTLGGTGASGGGGGGGAFIDTPAGAGLDGTANGGGGGGGLGRIFFRTRGAAAAISGGAIVKPAGISTTTL